MRFVIGALILALGGQVAFAETAPVVRQVSAPMIRSVRMAPFVIGDGGIRVADGSQLGAHELPAFPAATLLTRTAVTAQLADFASLTSALQGVLTPTGVRLERVVDGSIFATAGLRAGDTIVSVDGKRLASLDDVAELYARAGATNAANIQLVRGGMPLTLRVLIR